MTFQVGKKAKNKPVKIDKKRSNSITLKTSEKM